MVSMYELIAVPVGVFVLWKALVSSNEYARVRRAAKADAIWRETRDRIKAKIDAQLLDEFDTF